MTDELLASRRYLLCRSLFEPDYHRCACGLRMRHPRRPHSGRDTAPRYSVFAPEIAITFFHFVVSAWTNFLNASGVVGAAATPLS